MCTCPQSLQLLQLGLSCLWRQALAVCSDVLYVLSLQVRSRGCSLRSCEERFQLFFFTCTAPGTQLWFQPHLCMWATHRGLLPRLPWSTWFCPGKEVAQRQCSGQGRGSPGGDGCVGEPAAMGITELASAVTRHTGSQGSQAQESWPQ